MKFMLTTEDARQKFDDLGLSYKVIGLGDIDRLRQLIACELEAFLMSGTNNAESMEMTIARYSKKNDVTFNKGLLVEAYLKVDGSYFSGREAISFNRDGYIGFSGWADNINTEPFIKAFLRWCEILHKQQAAQ